MKPPVDRIRVSKQSRDTLVSLKRRTGIEHWNVLCRWGFVDSLANPDKPAAAVNAPDSNLEMTWDVFAGELSDAMLAAFALRAVRDGVGPSKTEMATYFRSHLERGISQLNRKSKLSNKAAVVLQFLAGYAHNREKPECL